MNHQTGGRRRGRRNGHGQRLAVMWGALVLMVPPGLASAAELDYRLGMSLQYSDNIALTETDEISETILIPSAAFVYTQEGERLDLQAAGSLEHRSYLDNSFSSEFRSQLAFKADVAILPQALTWTLQDYLATLPIDSQDPARPDNIQTTNLFLTGPTWIVRPWERTRLQLEARYANTYAETTDEFNSDRLSFAVRGFHQISPLATWSMHVEFYDVSTDDSVLTVNDYERRDLYGRYERNLPRWQMAVEAGVTRVRPEGQGWDEEPHVVVEASWTPNDSFRANAGLSRRVSDAAFDIIRNAPTVGDFDLDHAIPALQINEPTAQLFVENRANLRMINRGRGNTLTVNAFYREQEYLEDAFLDQSGHGASVVFNRQVRPRVAIGAYVRAEQRRFESVSRRDRDFEGGVNWTWWWLRNVAVSAGVSHMRRDSNAPGRDYTDNRATVSLIYRRR